MASFNVASVLEKMGKADKDFRHVGTNDLLKELSKEGFKVDSSSETKLVEKLLKQLGDSSKEVQTLTVKVIPLMVKQMRSNTLSDFLDTLIENILKGKEEIRDVSSLALVDSLGEISAGSDNGAVVAKKIPAAMIAGLQAADDDVNMRCLDVLGKLLKLFGPQVAPAHADLQGGLLALLNHKRQAVAKQAVPCLSHLSVFEQDKLFEQLMNHLMSKMESPSKEDNLSNHISTVGAVSRSVGLRIGPFLDKLVPLITKNIGDPGKSDPSDSEIDISKNCLATFEMFVARCPQEVASHLPAIIEMCLVWVSYDPNIMDDDDDEDEDEDEYSSEYSDDGGDDEDSTWMIRKAATKCLSAIISTRTELLSMLVEKVAPALIARFKEREVGVQENIFQTFEVLLQQIASAGIKSESTLNILKDKIPTICASVKSQLTKAERTQMNAFSLLSELIRVIPNGLEANVGDVVPGVVSALESDSKPLVSKALRFIRGLLASHQPAAFHPFIAELVEPVTELVGDSLFRIAADALRVVGELTRACRPEVTGGDQGGFDFKPFVDPLFSSTYAKLTSDNTDQEVKQCALRAMGFVVAVFGDSLANLGDALTMLSNGLKNELTQTFTVRAVGEVAASSLKVDISSVLSVWVTSCGNFLRKADRALRQGALTALANLTLNYSDKISDADCQSVLTEVAGLVDESDLNLAHLGLQLGLTTIQSRPAAVGAITSTLLPPCGVLVVSNVLQGTALESLVSFYAALVAAGGVSFDDLIKELTGRVSADTPKQAFSSVGQCIGAICAGDEASRDKVVGAFLKSVGSGAAGPQGLLALTSLGEIGHRVDMSKHAGIEKTVLAAFESESEDTKWAASFALGNIAVGNMGKYVPFVLEQTRSSSKSQYLLLQSIKEIIARQAVRGGAGVAEIQPYTEQIWTLLFEYCNSEQEGTRSIVAECLGKLALTDPANLIPALEERLTSEQQFTRSTVISAIRFTMSYQTAEVTTLLTGRMQTFFKTLADAEVLVRRAALMTLSYALSNRAELIYDAIPELLPMLYAETPLKPELIRSIKLGPFTQKVDDGADNRKLAFECMYTLLNTARDKLSMAEFTQQVVGGLADTQMDIILLCNSVLIRAAGPSLLQALDSMVENYKKILNKKIKDSMKETAKNEHAAKISSCLKAIVHMERIQGSESCVGWAAFMEEVVNGEKLAAQYAKTKDELMGTGTNNTMDTS